MESRTEAQDAARLDELLLKTSRTFALSIPVLPEPTRREVTVAYLLFRVADTLEDATLWTATRQVEQLNRLSGLLGEPTGERPAELVQAWQADPPLDNAAYLELLSELPAVLAAFENLTPAARALVAEHTRRTIDRMVLFVRRPRPLQLRDLTDLQGYCYAVAGIVGEMLTELFLLERPELATVAADLRVGAAQFGEALQLANILKDSESDVDEGRRYLPPGVERAEVFELARDDLERASEYVRLLQGQDAPRGIVAFTALPVLLARRTLDRVEQRGPGSKLTRPEVAEIVGTLDAALASGRPVA